jgi:hypothetical protein
VVSRTGGIQTQLMPVAGLLLGAQVEALKPANVQHVLWRDCTIISLPHPGAISVSG